MNRNNIKYLFFLVLLLYTVVIFAQQKSSNIRLPFSHTNQQKISKKTPPPIDTLLLFIKAKDSVTIDSLSVKPTTDSLSFFNYVEGSKLNKNSSTDQTNDIVTNDNIGYIIKPIPNPFEKDNIPSDSTTNNSTSFTPKNIETKTTSDQIPSEELIVEQTNDKLPTTDTINNLQKYTKNGKYATGYIGLGYNMSLVDVCGGVRLYQLNNLPLYFEIDLFFNSFFFKKFAEPIFVYRVMPSVNVGYTYEFSDFLYGVGLSTSAGIGPYHEGYSLLTDVGFEPIIKDQRFIKFAWDWAIDFTFFLDKEQKYRLMLKHKMTYLTKSNFGNTTQSISLNILFRLDYKKIQEQRKIENIYLNY
ncbi:MAG: hypothetical protein ACRC0A_00455 [Chitinophagaceae bacterium]